MDGHIYRGALAGGDVVRVTIDDGVWHFLHGVSPDGSRLAYVRLADLSDAGRLAVMNRTDTSIVLDTGSGHLDGPEWSPDGAWIYFNTETFTRTSGHAQLARIPDGGGGVERLVESSTRRLVPAPVRPTGGSPPTSRSRPAPSDHPPDLDVEVRVVATTDWSTSLQSYPLFGGQGTINVNSWSPDSSRFAFVAYPVATTENDKETTAVSRDLAIDGWRSLFERLRTTTTCTGPPALNAPASGPRPRPLGTPRRVSVAQHPDMRDRLMTPVTIREETS